MFRFKISRYCVMNGIMPPFPNSDSCDSLYWKNRRLDTNHSPEQYIQYDSSTYMSLDEVIKVSSSNDSFIEIGCNAGRNLNYLYEKGFRNLAGIEINDTAVNVTLKKYFPDLYAFGKFYVGNAAEEIRKIPDNSFDTVFSIYVLIHINPEYKSLFKDMVRISKKYIIVTTSLNGSPFPYDFVKIFTDLGCKEIYSRINYENGSICKLPENLYNKKRHFYNEYFVKIFIKENKE